MHSANLNLWFRRLDWSANIMVTKKKLCTQAHISTVYEPLCANGSYLPWWLPAIAHGVSLSRSSKRTLFNKKDNIVTRGNKLITHVGTVSSSWEYRCRKITQQEKGCDEARRHFYKKIKAKIFNLCIKIEINPFDMHRLHYPPLVTSSLRWRRNWQSSPTVYSYHLANAYRHE